jgi:hypothetical protein
MEEAGVVLNARAVPWIFRFSPNFYEHSLFGCFPAKCSFSDVNYNS